MRRRDPLVYRLFNLQSHYRKPLTFSFESLDNAAQAYQKLTARVTALSKDGEPDMVGAKIYREQFREALGNDLNTSQALTVLYDMLKSDLSDSTKRWLAGDFDKVLGLDLLAGKGAEASETVDGELAREIEELIARRAEARRNKDWAAADAIRDELAARRVVVKDTPEGVKWHIES